MPQNDPVSFDIDAAATGPTSELRVLPWRERNVLLPIPFDQFLQHHTLRGHIDPKGQGFGREDNLDKSLLKERLSNLLECGEHSRVVRGDSTLQSIEPLVISKRRKILIRNGKSGRHHL